MDFRLEAGVSGLWTEDGSQWILNWRRESVEFELVAGVSGF